MEDVVLAKKRSAVIKLAKELKPYDPELGPDMVPIYVETITEDLKQIARDMRKFAKLLPRDLTVVVDEEVEPMAKLLRRYATRIRSGCNNIYDVTFIDFEGREEGKIDQILEDGEDDDDDPDA